MSFINHIKNAVYSIEGNTLTIRPDRSQYSYYLPSPIRRNAIYATDDKATYLRPAETILEGLEKWTFTIDPTKDYESDYLFCVYKPNQKIFIYEQDALKNCTCGVQSGYNSFATPFQFTAIKGYNFDDMVFRADGSTQEMYLGYWYKNGTQDQLSGITIRKVNNSQTDNISVLQTSNLGNLTSTGIFIIRQIKADTANNVTITINGTLTNCSCNYANGSTFDSNVPITITADYDYEFTQPQYTAQLYNNDDFIQNINFENNSEKNTLTINGGSWSASGNRLIINASTIKAEKEPPKTALTQWVRIYAPTAEEMNSLAQETSSLSWLLGFYYLPFDISEYLSTEKKQIKMGLAISTKTTAYEYLYWGMTVKGGTLKISEKYQNVYDYKYVDITLHIPFFGEIKLDTDLIMGSDLNLTYELNLYQGLATAIITRFTDDIPIYQSTKKVGYYTPVVTTWVGLSDTTLSIPYMEKNFYFSALIKRNKPYPDNGFYGKVNKFYSKLAELTGYTVVTEIQLDDSIPYEIQGEIRQILERGVFV